MSELARKVANEIVDRFGSRIPAAVATFVVTIGLVYVSYQVFMRVRTESCPTCRGRGVKEADGSLTCERCGRNYHER